MSDELRVPSTAALYARTNLFVGKYQVPKDGHIRLDHARVRILRGTVTEEGWMEDREGNPWLLVEDGGFWPVMIQLDLDEDELPAVAAPNRGGWRGTGVPGWFIGLSVVMILCVLVLGMTRHV